MKIDNQQVLVDTDWLRELFGWVSEKIVANVNGTEVDDIAHLNLLHREIQLYLVGKPVERETHQTNDPTVDTLTPAVKRQMEAAKQAQTRRLAGQIDPT